MIAKALYCIPVAAAYQVATNPFVLAPLLALFGYWEAGAWLLVAYLLLCAASIVFGVHRKSRFEPFIPIFTAPDWLFVFGNEQEGQDPFWYQMKHPKWPKWMRAFVFCAWRNKLRNLPFVTWLSWLHKPTGEMRVYHAAFLGSVFTIRIRGWMVELEEVRGKYFADIGPRLDQPDHWGGVSWAFRPAGRL